GFAATTNPGGARKWRKDYAAFLRGARVVLLPDNDEAGRDHMARIAEGLAGIARDVHTVDLRTIWPECPHKGDVSDYVAAGGTAEELEQLAAISAPGIGPKTSRPVITLKGGELPRVVDEAEAALLASGGFDLYQRGGIITRPALSELKASDDRNTR